VVSSGLLCIIFEYGRYTSNDEVRARSCRLYWAVERRDLHIKPRRSNTYDRAK